MSKVTESYIKARREAIEWLNREKKDFYEGVNILSQSGYKPVVSAKLAKQGDKPHTRQKLEYELQQMIGAWYDPSDPRFENVDLDADAVHGLDGIQETVSEEEAQNLVTEAENEKSKEADENQYPPIIQKIIYTFADCYKSRSILHKQLADMGELNTEEIVSKRKATVIAIKALSERMTVLHQLKDKFEKDGVVPSEENLEKAFPNPEAEQDSSYEKNDHQKTSFDELGVDELKKMKANASTRLCRAKNMLEFSSVTQPKDGTPNPLPESPERIKYEKKVTQETELIEKIDYRLAELS